MANNNTTGGVHMSKNNLLVFILFITFLATPSLSQRIKAQDTIPDRSLPAKSKRTLKPLGEIHHSSNDTIPFKVSFPSSFRQTGRDVIVDNLAQLAPLFDHLRRVRNGYSDDTVRIVHIGDSHIRGHIYPQTTGNLLKETFGAVSYIDMGVNGATCLTFTHPERIVDIAALKPELLILSFGTNESHNRGYNSTRHYNQMAELVQLIRDSLPNTPILLTTPPGSYESFRRRRRPRTYAINPRTDIAAKTIMNFAKKNDLLAWDLYNVVGGKQRACLNWTSANLMRPDHVHYLPEGYVLQGTLLYQALIQAYNDYVSL